MKKGSALPNLEVVCRHCKGKGGIYDHESDSYVDCKICNGSGFTPTAFGARVLNLFRHQCRVTSELSVPAVR
jgi:ribosomal protein S27E